MKAPHKRAKKQAESTGGDYGGGTRRTIAKSTEAGMNSASTGATKTVAGNPRTGMGVKKGRSQKLTNHASPGGISAGRSRTRRGKNNTGSGPQGMKG